MARNSQSSFAARPALIHSWQLAVSDRMVCRPSLGSGEPLTRPAASRAATVAPIDCGRMPSARARLVTVAGPSRSRRLSTDVCDQERSPKLACSRSRRLSCPTTTRSSPANPRARASSIASTVVYMKENYKVKLHILNLQRGTGAPHLARTADFLPRSAHCGHGCGFLLRKAAGSLLEQPSSTGNPGFSRDVGYRGPRPALPIEIPKLRSVPRLVANKSKTVGQRKLNLGTTSLQPGGMVAYAQPGCTYRHRALVVVLCPRH